MTIFDLAFIAALLASAIFLLRALYLAICGRYGRSLGVLKRLAICAAAYGAILVFTSAVQPKQLVAPHVPQCFDEFCVAVDGAVRQPTLGAVRPNGEFLLVNVRVLNQGRGRRQRETDIDAVILDERGGRHFVSGEGQAALRRLGATGAALTDFVEAGATNKVRLVFDLPKDSRSLDFEVAHGWFPHMFIIGDPQSLFHRPTVVPLSAVISTGPISADATLS